MKRQALEEHPEHAAAAAAAAAAVDKPTPEYRDAEQPASKKSEPETKTTDSDPTQRGRASLQVSEDNSTQSPLQI